jgi:hypothetical protein
VRYTPAGVFSAITSGCFHSVAIAQPTDPTELVVALIQRVVGLNLQHGIENSLDAKLDTAFDALIDASTLNDNSAVNSLAAFINAVKAQRGKAIPAADADALIAAAQNIIDLLK